MAVEIKYKNQPMALLDINQRAILQTENTLLQDDIIVEVTGFDFSLQEKTIKENGEYTPDVGYQGFDRVVVDVPNIIPEGYIKPEGIKQIETNGMHDVRDYSRVNVQIYEDPPRFQEKTFFTSGEFWPDDGYAGFSKITVSTPMLIIEDDSQGNIALSSIPGNSITVTDDQNGNVTVI